MTNLSSLFLPLLLFFLPLVNLSAVVGEAAMTLLTGTCILLLLLCLQRARRGDAAWQPVPGLLPLALLTGLLFFQALPLPPALLRLLSPEAWNLYAETVWVARPGLWMPISLAPESTWASLFRLIACAAVYVVSIQALAARARVKNLLPFFVYCAGGAALFGMAFSLLSRGGGDGLLAGWTNPAPEQFAVVMAMALPVAVAQYLVSRPQVSYLPFRQKAAKFLRRPGAYPHILQGASFLLVLSGLLLSGSWAGVLGGAGGLLLFLLLLLTRSRGRKGDVWGVLILPAILLLTGAALLGGGGAGREDVGGGQVLQASRPAPLNAVDVVRDFPFWGTGAGTFAEASRRFGPGSGRGSGEEYAGNGYLDALAAVGPAGMLLSAWFLFSVLRRTLPAWRRRHSRAAVYLYAGALSGMFVFLSAAGTGGGLQESAAGLSLFFCAGVGVAAATSTSRPEGAPPAPPPLRLPTLAAGMLPLLLALFFYAGLTAAAFCVPGGHGVGGAGFSTEGAKSAPMRGVLAAGFAPLAAEYRYLLADSALARGEVAEALRQFAAALRLRPLHPEYLQRLGLVFANLAQDEKAERLLRSGAASEPTNPARQKVLASWLLSKGRGDEALEPVRLAIFWAPEKTWDFLALMKMYGLGDEEMRAAMPERSLPLLAYGEYLMEAGKESAAEESFLAAVRCAMTEARPSPVPFQRVAEIYAGRGWDEAALETVLAGVGIFPRDAALRFTAATLYERLGVTYRAIEEYRGVLALEPDNGTARARLRELGVSM